MTFLNDSLIKIFEKTVKKLKSLSKQIKSLFNYQFI